MSAPICKSEVPQRRFGRCIKGDDDGHVVKEEEEEEVKSRTKTTAFNIFISRNNSLSLKEMKMNHIWPDLQSGGQGSPQ